MIYVRVPRWLLLASIPLIITVFFVALGILIPRVWDNYDRNHRLEKDGLITTGVVIDTDLSCYDSTGDCTLYEVSYDFIVNGKTYHVANEILSDYVPGDPLYNRGDAISVIYLPDDPSYNFVATNAKYPSEKEVRLNLVLSGVFLGGLLGLVWTPYRNYSKTSWVGGAFFGSRFVVSYAAIIVFIELAALARQSGESFAIHMLWFYPILGIFGIPWLEVNRSGKPKDKLELRQEGYQGGSFGRIALEIAFPCFLAIYLLPLNFWHTLWHKEILLGIYIGVICVIALWMTRAWRWLEPMFNKFIA